MFYLHHELGEKGSHLILTVLSNRSINIQIEDGASATLRIIKFLSFVIGIYRSERRILTLLASDCQTFWRFIYLRLHGEEVVQIREKQFKLGVDSRHVFGKSRLAFLNYQKMFTKHTHLSSKAILEIPKKQSFLTKKSTGCSGWIFLLFA